MSTSKNGNSPGKRTPNKKAAGGKATPATKSVSIADSTDDLVLTNTTTEARADSRLLGRQLNVDHHNTLALIVKYKADFDEFGKVLFQTEPLPDSRTGQKEKFALLNEDQSFLLLTYSRNTSRVRGLKVQLVKAFGEARRAADLRQTDYLPVYHALHDQIKTLAAGSPNERFMHINCNKALNKFAGLAAGQRSGAPLPKQALLIVGQMVMARAMHKAKDSHTGFQQARDSLLELTACTRLEAAS
jgi:phage regulator Rha-like protein